MINSMSCDTNCNLTRRFIIIYVTCTLTGIIFDSSFVRYLRMSFYLRQDRFRVRLGMCISGRVSTFPGISLRTDNSYKRKALWNSEVQRPRHTRSLHLSRLREAHKTLRLFSRFPFWLHVALAARFSDRTARYRA